MIKLAAIFTDHMVFQRRKPIVVWGEGRKNIKISAELGGHRAELFSQDEKWQIELPAMEAAEKLTLRVTAEDRETGNQQVLEILDVAVGELWIASGQSNMEFLYRYDIERLAEKDLIPDDGLRFYDVPKVSYEGQLEAGHYEDYGFWRTWCKEDAEWFSAVGFYFGQMLRNELRVPIGIIGCNWGGCSAASFTNPKYMEDVECLRNVLLTYEERLKEIDLESYYKATDYMTAADPAANRAINDLMLTGVPFPVVMEKAASLQSEEERTYQFQAMQVGPRSFRRPGMLYKHMLSKIAQCRAGGVIWYQGEEDEIERADFYDVSLTALIQSFREHWEEIPFLLVQLPPFEGNAFALARKYPKIREMQEKAAKTISNVWCACATDAGEKNNIHPRKKRPVGERLGLLALKHVYGYDLEADSPELISAKKDNGAIYLKFSHTADGLYTDRPADCGIRVMSDGFSLKPDIEIQGDTIILKDECFLCLKELTVSYARDNYYEVSLYNSAGLPVFPFETKVGEEL